MCVLPQVPGKYLINAAFFAINMTQFGSDFKFAKLPTSELKTENSTTILLNRQQTQYPVGTFEFTAALHSQTNGDAHKLQSFDNDQHQSNLNWSNEICSVCGFALEM